MDPVGGWTTLLAALAVLLLATFPLRTRLRPALVDAMLALGGAGIGGGGLLFLTDVEPGSWAVAPTLLAGGSLAHVRFLLAGGEPVLTCFPDSGRLPSGRRNRATLRPQR